MHHTIPLALCLIGLCAVGCQLVAWFLNLPAILFLLLTGIILGPITGVLNPDQLFGDLLFPITSLAVAIILFEGSLTLKFSDILHQSKTLIRLTTIGATIVFTGVTITAFYTGVLSWQASLLLGSIMIVSGPTVIKPLLKAVKLKPNVAKLLYWDSIILDPLGALLVTLMAGYFLSHQHTDVIHTFLYKFTLMILFGVSFGVLNGFALGEIIKRHLLPNNLENIVILNWVIAAFVAANWLFEDTGLVVVTIMGITIANRKKMNIESMLDFNETISTLLLSALFIVLAARIKLTALSAVIPESILIFLFMQFVIQPFKIAAATVDSDLTWREKFILAWIAPKGIIAAALASIIAMKLQKISFIHADELIPITFLLIVYSVILPSVTAGWLAKVLQVIQPKENGVLILGANSLARAIAKILIKHQIPVMVADSSWENISQARLAHIPTYFGNITSDNAERTLDLTGIGKLFAITPNTELSYLARLRYSRIFGKKSIFYVQTEAEKTSADRHLTAEKHRGELLFGYEVTYEGLTAWLNEGGEIKATTLTPEFSFEEYMSKNKDRCMILFFLNKKNEINLADSESKIPVGATVVSLFFP